MHQDPAMRNDPPYTVDPATQQYNAWRYGGGLDEETRRNIAYTATPTKLEVGLGVAAATIIAVPVIVFLVFFLPRIIFGGE